MRKKLSALLRCPAAVVLLALELLLIAFGVVEALRPAAVYEIRPDQWESIAEASQITYDTDGFVGAAEATAGEDILRSPQMSLPAGHYRVTVNYHSVPATDENGRKNRSGVYFSADDVYVVTGKKSRLSEENTQTTVTLNVSHKSDTIRLTVFNGGGIFTVGSVTVQQDMAYAWVRVLGRLLAAVLLDLLVVKLVPASPLAVQDADLRGCLFLLGAAVLLASMPLMTQSGGVYGDDIGFHLSRIEGIAQGLREGQFPVRIYSEAKSGYGYAPSLFYGELLLYFPAVLRLLGVSIQLAYQIYILAVQILTAGIAFFSFRQIFRDNKTALLGSILYLLNPYRLQNIYWRAAVGEYTAMAFLPLVPAALSLLYGRELPDKQQTRKAWAELVIAFGLLVQTHMLSLQIVTLVSAVYCLFNLRRTFHRSVLSVWLRAAGTVILLNLWFLVPFLATMRSGQYERMYGGSDANTARYIQHDGGSVAGILTWNSFGRNVGIALLAGSLVFLWICIDGRESVPPRERKVGLWAAAIGGVACWMSTDAFPWGLAGSLPWRISRILLAIQFPWRYLMVAVVMLILVTLCAVTVLRRRKWAAVLAASLLCVSLMDVGVLYREYMQNTSGSYMGDIGELMYADGRSNEAWYFDSLYLPVGAQETRDGFENEMEVTTVEVTGLEKKNGVVTLQCRETTGEIQCAELPLLYYPGYKVLNGTGTTFKTANGMVGVFIPAGYEGSVQVAFREPLLWRLMDIISLMTVLVLAGRALYRRKQHA